MIDSIANFPAIIGELTFVPARRHGEKAATRHCASAAFEWESYVSEIAGKGLGDQRTTR